MSDLHDSPILLAYSGGLDTSFCVPWLRETYARPVVTVTINTGGLDQDAAADLARRAEALGAQRHIEIDAREAFYSQVLRYLIMGNVRRGHLYPLCVGAERGIQAARLAQVAGELGTQTVAHGCTAAGNDQVRFEVALKTIDPTLEVLAPVRDHAWARAAQLDYLAAHDLPAPPGGKAYSINRGLWGVTIGGNETLDSTSSLPEHAWVLSANAFDDPLPERTIELGFENGEPVSLDGRRLNPVELIEQVEAAVAPFAIGRGIHLGDTLLGTKGRVAFEAPAAQVLLDAHRELEKLTLSSQQQRVKDQVANTYGEMVHEGRHLDPACRDMEALLSSSQTRVWGEVTLTLRPGSAFVTGVRSRHSLMAATKGVYGEAAGEWTAQDALGYSRILSLPGMLQTRAGDSNEAES